MGFDMGVFLEFPKGTSKWSSISLDKSHFVDFAVTVSVDNKSINFCALQDGAKNERKRYCRRQK